jgi:hypothetical protein
MYSLGTSFCPAPPSRSRTLRFVLERPPDVPVLREPVDEVSATVRTGHG